MNLRRFIVVAVALLEMVFSMVPAHAMCPGPVDLNDWFAHSSAVFVGRAVVQRVVVTTADRHEIETTFEVGSLWKGEVKATLQVRTWACGGTTATDRGETVTCADDVNFRVGSTYVVFARGAPLEATDCGPTGSVKREERTLQWLSQKPLKKAG